MQEYAGKLRVGLFPRKGQMIGLSDRVHRMAGTQTAAKNAPAKASDAAPSIGARMSDRSRLSRENLLSFIIVSARDTALDIAEIEAISRFAEDRFDYYELLVVASAPPKDWQDRMRDLATGIPNARIITIDTAMCYEELAMVALRHAIGDYIVSLHPGEIGVSEVERIIEQLSSGEHDLVKAVHAPGAVPASERLAATLVGWAIRIATGQKIQSFQARAFALSRTAVSRLVNMGGALKFFRILDLSGHFPQAEVVVAGPRRRRFLDALSEKIHLAADLVSLSASRLIRTLAFICFALSVASMMVTLGSFLIWVFKSDVAPGWTSLTMVSSLLFAANFGVLAAVCLGLYQLIHQNEPDALDLMTTELSGGDFFHRESRLNVETGEGEV